MAGLLFLAGLGSWAQAQVTVAFTSSAQAGGLGLNSNNSAWSTSGGFSFELGVFNSGFTPTSANTGSWNASWTVAASGANPGATTWINDDGATYFASTGAYTSNAAPFTAGTQLYIWGYNSKAISASSEWILITNSAWVVQTVGSPSTRFLDTTDSGTIAILGAITNGGLDLQSAAVVSAVPEPAAYAALAGVVVLGLGVVRRRRGAA